MQPRDLYVVHLTCALEEPERGDYGWRHSYTQAHRYAFSSVAAAFRYAEWSVDRGAADSAQVYRVPEDGVLRPVSHAQTFFGPWEWEAWQPLTDDLPF